MKFIAAYYLLLFYAAAMFKPLIPLVSDFVAHQFARTHHISTVHQQHGENHAQEDLAASTDDRDDEQAAKSKFPGTLSWHIYEEGIDYHIPFHSYEYNVPASPGISKFPLKVTVPPPKCLFT